jgi:hypothetical protein
VIGVLPSLIIWLVFKDRGSFTNTEAKEALNFQITLIFGYIVLSILLIVFIGAILIWAVWIVGSCSRSSPSSAPRTATTPLPVRHPPHQVGRRPRVSPVAERPTPATGVAVPA